MMPLNWDEEMKRLRTQIRAELNLAAEKIVREETEKILGRVKIITHQDLGRREFDWFIEAGPKRDE